VPRLLPSPWRAEKNSFGYVVRDANGQTLAYIPSRSAPETEAAQAGVLTDDEARIVAACIAQLPQLLRRPTDRVRSSRLIESCFFRCCRSLTPTRLLRRAGVQLAAMLNKVVGR
jgi:hypothetical protein